MDRAAAGEEVLVTRHGKPFVRVSPAIPPLIRRWPETRDTTRLAPTPPPPQTL
jgi:prevent-host-death family protein